GFLSLVCISYCVFRIASIFSACDLPSIGSDGGAKARHARMPSPSSTATTTPITMGMETVLDMRRSPFQDNAPQSVCASNCLSPVCAVSPAPSERVAGVRETGFADREVITFRVRTLRIGYDAPELEVDFVCTG